MLTVLFRCVYAESPAITLALAAKTATLGEVSRQSPAVSPETGGELLS